MAYNTGNPIGSADVRDLYDNAQNLDKAMNSTDPTWIDRFGVARPTFKGAESELNHKVGDAEAAATQALGYLNTMRATSYGPLADDPTTDPLGNPCTAGDEYFNTTYNLLKRFDGSIWRVPDINTENLASGAGSSMVGHGGQTVEAALNERLPEIGTYALLRAYAGPVTAFLVRGVANIFDGGFGVFRVDASDTTTADNGGTVLVDASGRRWKRVYPGAVNVKWFGAVGDGVADDTTARNSAINVAKSRRASVFFPSGTYRVTSGYVQSVAYADVHMFGEGSTREGAGGSLIKLDSTDPASFFYQSTANHNLQVNDLVFTCAQFVKDRAFFRLGANTSQFFTRANFESVERPIVYSAGTYFQNAAYRDVQFRNSGTFHSESAALIGGMLLLENVNHEGSVPDNTEKIICNLSGIRQIQGVDFLLEGVSPGAGWTALKLGTTYDADWTAAPLAEFNGFWIEFSGDAFGYCVEQMRGIVSIKSSNAFATATNQYRLTEKAVVEIDAGGFTNTAYDPATAFSMDSVNCAVKIRNSAVRLTRQLVQQRIFYNDCFVASSDANMSMARFSNSAPDLLYAYDGKVFDSTLVTTVASGGTTLRNETDATNGRKLSVYPASNAIDANLRANGFGQFSAGDQFIIKLRAKLPAFTGGQIQFQAYSNTGALAAFGFDAATYSGQEVTLTIPFRLVGSATSVGLRVVTAAVTTISAAVEIYHLEIYRGGSFTNGYRTAYPKCLTFHATAAPVNGTWAVGDRAVNSAPAVGQPKSWVCTVAGTPGTWVSEGVL